MSYKKVFIVISTIMICMMLNACSVGGNSAGKNILKEEISEINTEIDDGELNKSYLDNSDIAKNQNNEKGEEVDLTNMHKLVGLYEEIAHGSPICEGTSKSFIMKLVEYLGVKDKYVKYADDYEIFTMPAEEVSKILSFFIVDQCPAETYIYGDDMYIVYSQDVILEPFDINISNDELKVLYGRFSEDKNGLKHWLYPVRYTMSTYVINGSEVPDILKGYLKDGETGFRIKNIETINNVNSAKEIYCNNGYDSMFEERSYEISSVDDLLAMAERVNSSMYNEIHASYTLTCDLDMTDVDYIPIGACEYFYPEYYEANPVDYGFCGTFDGNNHTISNIKYVSTVHKYDGTGPENNLGMFARLGEGSIVKNLNISNAYIDYVKDENFEEIIRDYIDVRAGILSGYFKGSLIENCNVNGIVNGITCVGGLVGNADDSGSIINCHSDVDVYGETWVGGLVGDNSGVRISNCTAKGTVAGDKFSPRKDIDMPIGIGGFVGLNIGTVENCGASVWVKTMVNCRCVGSFAGMNDKKIINCIYNSTVGNWNPIGESYVYSSEVDDAVGYQREDYYNKLEDGLEED
nr:GLUG motif-containing protein [Sedimentibacter sp.]